MWARAAHICVATPKPRNSTPAGLSPGGLRLIARQTFREDGSPEQVRGDVGWPASSSGRSGGGLVVCKSGRRGCATRRPSKPDPRPGRSHGHVVGAAFGLIALCKAVIPLGARRNGAGHSLTGSALGQVSKRRSGGALAASVRRPGGARVVTELRPGNAQAAPRQRRRSLRGVLWLRQCSGGQPG